MNDYYHYLTIEHIYDYIDIHKLAKYDYNNNFC